MSNSFEASVEYLHELQEAHGLVPSTFTVGETPWYLDTPSKKDIDYANTVGGLDGHFRHLSQILLNGIPDAQADILRAIPVGVLNTHNIYAETRKSISGAQVIAVHVGLALFVHDMARLLVAGLRAPRVLEHDAYGLLICTLMRKAFYAGVLFLFDKRLKGTHFIRLPDPLWEFEAAICRNAVQAFCVAHEYSHALHIGANTSNYTAELMADTFAVNSTLSAELHPYEEVIKENPGVRVWQQSAPCVFFALAHFVETLKADKTQIDEQLKISPDYMVRPELHYPSAIVRFNQALEALTIMLGTGSTAIQHSHHVWGFVELLCELYRNALSQGLFRNLEKVQ